METLKLKFNQFKIPIIAFVIILTICICGYYLSHSKRVDGKLNYIEKYLKNKKSYALDFCSDKYRGYPILDYHICSSTNTIASNLTKYDHYSSKMIESAIRYGARFIELEIHNKDLSNDTIPVISIGTERGKWKKGLNIIDLKDAFSVIKKKAFNEEIIPNYTDPFFIFFNLKTDGNVNTLDILHDTILEIFGSKLLDRRYRNQRLDVANTSMCDLIDKIVILSSGGYEGSKFENIINLSTNHPKLTRITFSELDKRETFNLQKPNVFIKSKKIVFRDGYLDKYDYIQVNDYMVDLKEMGVKSGQLIKIDGASNPRNNSYNNKDLFKIKQVTRNKILLSLSDEDKLIPENSGNEISLRIYNDVKEKLDIEKLTRDGLFIVVPDEDLFSSNFAAKTAWFSGAQFAALNFHNPDEYLLQYLNFFDNASIKLKIPGIQKGKKKIQENTEDLSAKYPAPSIENLYDVDPDFFTNFMDKDIQITPGKNNELKITIPEGDEKDLRISPSFNLDNSSFFIQEGNSGRLNTFSIRIPGKNSFLSINNDSNNSNKFLTIVNKPIPLDDLSSDARVKEMEDFKENTSFLPLKPRCLEDGFLSLAIVHNKIQDGEASEIVSYVSSNNEFNPKEKIYTKFTEQARIIAEFNNGYNTVYIVRPIGEKGFHSVGDVLIQAKDSSSYTLSGGFIQSIKGFKTFGGAIEQPIDYDLIWAGVSDTNTDQDGNNNNSSKNTYSIWKPIAPVGYTCPGYIVNKRKFKPNKNQIVCIKDEFLETSTQPPPGRRLLYELMWNNRKYSNDNKKKGLTLWIPNVLESDRTFEYFVPYDLFNNPLYTARENNSIFKAEQGKNEDVITEYEYEFVAPNDFDFPQYILAKTEAFTLDKLSLKQMLSGKIEKLNACFKFSRVFKDEPNNQLDIRLLNNLGEIKDDVGSIKNFARNEYGGKMCLSLDNSYWSQTFEKKFADIDDYRGELKDPLKNKIFTKKCGGNGHFGTNWVYNHYDKTIRLSGNTEYCLTSPYKEEEPILDEQLYLKECNTNQPGQEFVLKENGNIQSYNGIEKDACIFNNANNIVKLSYCSERMRKKFRFDSLPPTFCLGVNKPVYILYKSKRERNLKAKLSVIPEVVDNPLDELMDFNYFHVYIRGRILKSYDNEHFIVKLGLTDKNDYSANFQILNNDGNDYKIKKLGESNFEIIIPKDSSSIILDPSPNPLVNGDFNLNMASNVLCKNGAIVSDFITIPESICKFKAKVVQSVGEFQYQVVFSINGIEYDKQNKNHFRPRKVTAKTFNNNEINIMQKAPICK